MNEKKKWRYCVKSKQHDMLSTYSAQVKELRTREISNFSITLKFRKRERERD